MASDGSYAGAMGSEEDMQYLIDGLHYRADEAANMDW
jgi:hypothetical protein